MNRAFILLCFALVACADDDSSRAPGAAGTTGAETTTPVPTDDSGSSGSPSVRADLGVEPPAACEGSCAVALACQGLAVSDCLLQCSAELADAALLSPACGAAQEALEVCVAALSCDELAAHDAGEAGPCRDAAQQAAIDCDGSGATPSAVCDDLCTALVDCDLAEGTACRANCVELRSAAATSGESCAAAQDEQLTCVGALDCTALDEWVSTGSTPTCPDQLDQACAGDEE